MKKEVARQIIDQFVDDKFSSAEELLRNSFRKDRDHYIASETGLKEQDDEEYDDDDDEEEENNKKKKKKKNGNDDDDDDDDELEEDYGLE